MKSYSPKQRIASWIFWCLYSAALPVAFVIPDFRHSLLAHPGPIVLAALFTSAVFRFLPMPTSVAQILLFVGSCFLTFAYLSIVSGKSAETFVFIPSCLTFGVLFLVLVKSSGRNRGTPRSDKHHAFPHSRRR